MPFQPHESWADVYDLAYERAFGEAYKQLTDLSIRVIAGQVRPPARIVDFGAGTGRLAIPLATMGFDVTAVEPCQAMLDRLAAKNAGQSVHTICSTMEGFTGDGAFDMALCVFTVILYLIDEGALAGSLAAAHAALKPGGLLLIDVPSKVVFRSFSIDDEMIDRRVRVTPVEGDLYRYEELLTVRGSDGDQTYSDAFPIRYWPLAVVKAALERAGFILETDLSDQFASTGSQYLLMRSARQPTTRNDR